MDLKIKRLTDLVGFPLPEYATDGSSGLDLRAAIKSAVLLHGGESTKIPCGFAIEIPEGYEGQVRARSGLALKHHIGLTNGIGTIDSDYRGELAVLLTHHGHESETKWVMPGEKIAQLVIVPIAKVVPVEVSDLSETERGANGYGSTGTGLADTPVTGDTGNSGTADAGSASAAPAPAVNAGTADSGSSAGNADSGSAAGEAGNGGAASVTTLTGQSDSSAPSTSDASTASSSQIPAASAPDASLSSSGDAANGSAQGAEVSAMGAEQGVSVTADAAGAAAAAALVEQQQKDQESQKNGQQALDAINAGLLAVDDTTPVTLFDTVNHVLFTGTKANENETVIEVGDDAVAAYIADGAQDRRASTQQEQQQPS